MGILSDRHVNPYPDEGLLADRPDASERPTGFEYYATDSATLYRAQSGSWIQISNEGGGEGGVSDGDKGDIVVSSSGTSWVVQDGVITPAKLSFDPATQTELNAEAALARNADNLTSGTVPDARIPSAIARDSEVTSAVAAEAALARNADNLTSGTVEDARIASTIARDSEVTSAIAAEAALARNADNLTSGTVADNRIASTIARDSEVAAAVAAVDAQILTPGSTATITPSVVGDDITWDLNSTVPANVFTLGHVSTESLRSTFTYAHLATVAALPTSTYNNSINGAGATLTATANGAAAAVDNVTPSVGDRILVRNQASAFQNGLYSYTQIGSAGTPWILTRVGEADEAANYTRGITVLVLNGDLLAGSVWRARGTVTMGTTSIYWQQPRLAAQVTPVDVYLGPGHGTRNYASDLDEFATAMVVGDTLKPIPGTQFSTVFQGTGSGLTQLTTDGTGIGGVASLSTGTTAAGYAFIEGGMCATIFDVEKPAAASARLKAPVQTASTDLYAVRFGLMDVPWNPYSGIYLELPKTASELGYANGNWQFITHKLNTTETLVPWTRSGTVVTFTRVAHGLAVGDGVAVTASSATGALPNTALAAQPYYVQTVPTADTFTVVGINASSTSGTASIQRLTRTITDTGVAWSAVYRNFGFDYSPITKAVRFFSAGVLAATHTTNIPDGNAEALYWGIAKAGGSTGTTAVTLSLDYVSGTMTDSRNLPMTYR